MENYQIAKATRSWATYLSAFATLGAACAVVACADGGAPETQPPEASIEAGTPSADESCYVLTQVESNPPPDAPGPLPDDPGAFPILQGLNDRGEALVRFGNAACGDCVGGSWGGFVWRDGVRVDLRVPAGFTRFGGVDLNERGEVAGIGYLDGRPRVLLWRDGAPIEIPVPTSGFDAHSIDLRINERGHVASSGNTGLGGELEVALWRDGAVTELGRGALVDVNDRDDVLVVDGSATVLVRDGRRLAIDELQARLLDDRGRIIGSTPGTTRSQAAIWDEGRVTRLGTLGGRFSYPTGTNARGDVIGTSTTTDALDDPMSPFFWRDGKMVAVAGPDISAEDVNDAGEVVGRLRPSEGPVYVWRDGVRIDLPVPSGMSLLHPAIGGSVANNDAGMIATTAGTFGAASPRYWLLVWTPKPSCAPPTEPPPEEVPEE